MIDFNKFSILSVMGKKAGNLSDHEYTRTVLANCDKYLEDIKKARAEIEQNKNKGTEEKEMYL